MFVSLLTIYQLSSRYDGAFYYVPITGTYSTYVYVC